MIGTTFKSKGCTFCSELNNELSNSNFCHLSGQCESGRILWRNKKFAIIPSLGPLVEGHLLLIPACHELSFANLDAALLQEAEKILNAIVNLFFIKKQRTIFFEHGAIVKQANERARIAKALSGLCTDHAHIHILPGVSVDLVLKKIEDAGLHSEKKEFKNLVSLPDIIPNNMPYLCVGGTQPETRVVYMAEELPSQFMRQLVASIMGETEWDWTKAPKINIVQKTIETIGPELRLILDRLGTS